MTWLSNHWVDILAIFGGVSAVAKVVVNLTPSDTDNQVLDKVVRFFEMASGLFTKTTVGNPDNKV